jgi:hypothetical protein
MILNDASAKPIYNFISITNQSTTKKAALLADEWIAALL